LVSLGNVYFHKEVKMLAKVIFIILLISIAVLPIVRCVWPQVAAIGYIIMIVAGVSFDLMDFTIRVVASLQRRQVPSAGMFFGLLLMGTGLHGFTVLSHHSIFGWSKWSSFFALFFVACIAHMIIHLLFPLLFTMICNAYYRRKLMDMSTLPQINKE